MISASDQMLLDSALQAVQQRRAAQTQANQAAAQAKIAAQSKLAAVGAKAASTASTKNIASKTPKAKNTAPASTITPYLTADDLMGANDQVAASEDAQSAARSNYSTAAAKAIQNAGDIQRGTVKNVSDANNDAAARGIYRSGIRAGNVQKALSAGARGQVENQGALALAKGAQDVQINNAQQHLASYAQSLIAKAAENGAALPVDPGYQNGAVNVKGAATVKKAAR